MANERAYVTRNTGTAESPIWERWFFKTVADAVMMSDKDGETKNIKDYVDESITALIGGSPTTADTLKELYDLINTNKDAQDLLDAAIANKADADHGHDVATTEKDGFMSKTDKEKLNSLTNYTHPDTHAATMITEDTTHRFVTDEEKALWNAGGTGIENKVDKVEGKGLSTNDLTDALKANYDAAYTHSTTYHAPADAQKNVQADWNAPEGDAFIKNKPSALPADGGNATTVNNHTVNSDVPADAVFTDTVYTHPTTHDATMINEDTTHRFVTDTEKNLWNSKTNVYVDNSLPASAPTGSICFVIE